MTPARSEAAPARRSIARAPILALVGDYSPAVPAHQAIPRAIELAGTAERSEVSWQWIRTSEVTNASRDLARFDAVWVVPASPYENMQGALDAIRWAREHARPFLGTCGGFQHAIIEFARNAAGIADADHSESNPHAPAPLVTRLSCALVEKTGTLHFIDGSQIERAYGSNRATEGYHCRYGLNTGFRARLEAAGLGFTGFDEAGDVRAFELPTHPFFFGTLFQPERSALGGEAHPLIRAFLRAINSHAR